MPSSRPPPLFTACPWSPRTRTSIASRQRTPHCESSESDAKVRGLPHPRRSAVGENAHSRWFSERTHTKFPSGTADLAVVSGARHIDLHDDLPRSRSTTCTSSLTRTSGRTESRPPRRQPLMRSDASQARLPHIRRGVMASSLVSWARRGLAHSRTSAGSADTTRLLRGFLPERPPTTSPDLSRTPSTPSAGSPWATTPTRSMLPRRSRRWQRRRRLRARRTVPRRRRSQAPKRLPAPTAASGFHRRGTRPGQRAAAQNHP